MVVTVRNRHRTVIKVAGPKLLLLICFGGVLINISGIVEFLQVTVTTCTARVWLLHLGFAFVYGPLLLKIWRISLVEAVSSINVSEEVSKSVSSSGVWWKLSLIVLPVFIDLIVWSVVSNLTLQLVQTGTQLKYHICHEDWMDYGIMLAEFLFLLWGVYLCFKRRNVVTPYNEARYIAWGIYVTTFWKNFMTVIRIFLSQSIDPDVLYLLYIMEWQVPVTLTLIMLFLPKIYRTRRRRINKINPTTLVVQEEDDDD
ncbi:hypothetical protein RvY_13370 [Ramazzottius varieornatus]|uniref:G-protein coupled receptors family 3 profile domain-containing protein n=1 Tax=Ramazzottius varieornatus TaxID=947166 RepID=A0A1D1VPS8_RAMVA|nr:hypothetical protein RvY_13370 [Ramazzottius varieornatus]